MKKRSVIGVFLTGAIFVAPASYADGMSKCVNAYIKDTKLNIGGYYSNADGTSRDAAGNCERHYREDRRKFEREYGKVEKKKEKPAAPVAVARVDPRPKQASVAVAPAPVSPRIATPSEGGNGERPNKGSGGGGGQTIGNRSSVANHRSAGF